MASDGRRTSVTLSQKEWEKEERLILGDDSDDEGEKQKKKKKHVAAALARNGAAGVASAPSGATGSGSGDRRTSVTLTAKQWKKEEKLILGDISDDEDDADDNDDDEGGSSNRAGVTVPEKPAGETKNPQGEESEDEDEDADAIAGNPDELFLSYKQKFREAFDKAAAGEGKGGDETIGTGSFFKMADAVYADSAAVAYLRASQFWQDKVAAAGAGGEDCVRVAWEEFWGLLAQHIPPAARIQAMPAVFAALGVL